MSELICYEALKLIEKRLSQYELIKKAVADCRADHNYNGKSGGKGKAFISDPTANEAVSNITPLNSVVIEIDNKIIKIKKPEKWLELARAVFEHFSKHCSCSSKSIKMILYYKFIRHKNYNFICTKLEISKNKYYKELDKILWFALSYACQIGLIKVR